MDGYESVCVLVVFLTQNNQDFSLCMLTSWNMRYHLYDNKILKMILD
jgi:hypothetical protein